jgi:hypothetical protein
MENSMHTSTTYHTAKTKHTSIETMNKNLEALIEQFRKEVALGFLDSHARSNKNAGKALEIASFCYALVELLEEKGIITFGEMDDRQKVVSKRLVKKFAQQGMGVVALQDYREDKYTYSEEIKIDCESRVHICHAACCQLELALSKQDLEEGVISWDLARPYMISRCDDGYCAHLDRAGYKCTVWQNRPIPCRGYDCRKDERIWLDFEECVFNPSFKEILNHEMTAQES